MINMMPLKSSAVQLVFNPFSQLVPQLELYSQLQLSLNPMSAKLHHFATKIAVCDSFALGLEQFESKKLAKVRTTLQKEKYFKNIVHVVLCNSTQSQIT